MEVFMVHGPDPNEVETEINHWIAHAEKTIPGFRVVHIKQSIAPPDSPVFLKENPRTQPDLEPWLLVSIWFERNPLQRSNKDEF